MAQSSLENIEDNLNDLEQNIDTTHNIITDPEERSAFIKNEWDKAIADTGFGKFLSFVKNLLNKVDPVFNIFLGVNFSWSWIFYLTILLWILFLLWGFRFLSVIEPYLIPHKYDKYMKYGIFVIWFIALSSIRIPRFCSQAIIEQISKANGWFLQLLLMMVVILILLFISAIFKIIKRIFIAIKKEKRLKRTENKVKKQSERIEELEDDDEYLRKIKQREKEERELSEAAKEEIEGLGGSEE